jgi:hypothetical protein
MNGWESLEKTKGHEQEGSCSGTWEEEGKNCILILHSFPSACTMSIKPVAVIDNGTGYTKMGFSGNCEPNYIIPTAISVKQDVGAVGKSNGGIEDLDYFIGNEVQKEK